MYSCIVLDFRKPRHHQRLIIAYSSLSRVLDIYIYFVRQMFYAYPSLLTRALPLLMKSKSLEHIYYERVKNDDFAFFEFSLVIQPYFIPVFKRTKHNHSRIILIIKNCYLLTLYVS